MDKRTQNKYPRIVVNRDRLLHNYKQMLEIASEQGISVFAVSKAYCALPEILKIVKESGVKYIADSRIENLEKIKDFGFEKKVLLRIPMPSEVDDVVRLADISLNSEILTLEKLNEAALRQNKKHGIMIMVDLGDLREGMTEDEAVEFAGKILEMEGLTLEGIGVNLTCYGGVIPSEQNLGRLTDTARRIEEKYSVKLNFVSGGNSSSVQLMMEGKMPKGINNVRLGESILRGLETAYTKQIPNMKANCFTIEAELIEIKEKDSVPTGDIGFDAFGRVPTFTDKGRMLRGLVAIGKQDVGQEGLIPVDEGIEYIGGSSDHTIFDLTNSKNNYKVGDILEFNLDYGAILGGFTSAYLNKVIK